MQKVLDPKHLNEQDQKDAESAFPINNTDNDLKTPDLKQTLEDLDEVK
jgi:hypothetical protein